MNWTCLSINGGSLNFASIQYISPYPDWAILSNIDWGGGGGFNPPPYDFALTVEIGECDTCLQSNFTRPAHLKK